ncbi:iron(III) transport system permease protein [Neorhizobium galegae]|uniref:ABC transporter permease n=1 Tax=Neorhizobium galegae TaxID=399 RepID=UPI00277F2FBD|nr:ABC transporter permease subunit [Neorhizobium galegae]MDQ0137789.1 iron(III) transport system permease protein [Neorhizobium galegae]
MSSLTRTLRRIGLSGAAFCLTLIVFVYWPLLTLISGAFKSTPFGGGELTLSGFSSVFGSAKTYQAFGVSVAYSGLVLVFSLGIGLAFAFATARSGARLTKLLIPSMILIAAIPRLFFAVSWGMIGAPRSGMIASLFRWADLDMPDWLTVYSFGGLVFVTVLKVSAVAFLLLLGPVLQIDRSLEDAAIMSGASRRRAVFKISLPLLTPALLAIALLMFVEGIQVYDFPALLASPAGIETLSTSVEAYLNKEATPQWASATALSLMVILLISLLLVVQAKMMGGRDFTSIVGKSRQPVAVTRGTWDWLVSTFILMFIGLALVLPLVQMILGSLQPYFGMYGTYTLSNYASIFSNRKQVMILLQTLATASLGGVVVIALAFTMAYVEKRSSINVLKLFIRIASWVPAAAPGIVLSLAFVWTFVTTPGLKALYGSNILMAIALVIAHLPLAIRACEGILAQVSPELEDAARMSAASPATVMLAITARLCAPSLAAAWVLVSLAIAGALDVPLLLQSTNSQTVATFAYSLFNNGEVALAAAFFLTYLALFMMLVGLLYLAVLYFRAVRNQPRISASGAVTSR